MPRLLAGLRRMLLFCAVLGHVVRVDERTPHHDAAVGRDRFGEHVRTVGMRPAEILRTRLSLRVRLDQEAAEVRNQAVNLISLLLPLRRDFGIERISRLQAAQLDGR